MDTNRMNIALAILALASSGCLARTGYVCSSSEGSDDACQAVAEDMAVTGNLLQTDILMENNAASPSASTGRIGLHERLEAHRQQQPVGQIDSIAPRTRPHIIMAVDVDYPPYAYVREPPYGSPAELDEVVGVGADMIKGMAEHCDFDVTITQAHWSDCWTNGEIGAGLREGWYHGCMTYTHAAGVRNRYLDFTDSWAIKNKPSGLITRLTNGVPHINGMDDLSGRTIVDVTGWAPTADTLQFVSNSCTGSQYGDYTVVQGDDLYAEGEAGYGRGPNDRALRAVLDGRADAMWVYGDQAANYQCNEGETQDGWDCDLWSGFGSTFAYVQSGMFGWMYNGTTVAISKKGSGLNELLNPCLASFMQTEAFHRTCKIEHHHHNQLQTCVPNEFIQADPEYREPNPAETPYMFPTSAMADASHSCSTGYCGCSG